MTAAPQPLRAWRPPSLPGLARVDAQGWLWPAAAIALILALQFTLVFQRAINWDEFHHYAQVQLFTRGTLLHPLQTFYVRLFQWLPALRGGGVDHIVVARIVMFACEAAAAGGIALLAARFTDRATGLLCALCYLTAGFVLQHGFSFRADPIVAALLMGALCVLACTRFRGLWLLLFGALLALAVMVTIKIVLYAPAFLGLAWLRWQDESFRPAFLYRLLGAGVMSAATFALLYAYHASNAAEVIETSGGVLSSSAGKMFQLGLPVFWRYILKAALLSPLFVALILLFPLALKRSRLESAQRIALVGLFLPIGVLSFYHNIAPYFYAFILPPVAAACAVPMAAARLRFSTAALAAAFACVGVALWADEDRGIIDRQRALLAAADAIFPGRISYFDYCGMLGRHDKANIFMTTWGSERYRHGDVPSMRETMETRVVPLVLENEPMFTRLLRTRAPEPRFLPEDVAAVRSTYLHFWGPFWIAGKIIPAEARREQVEILVPGPYTLAGGAIEIGGKQVRANDVVQLRRGLHEVTTLEGRAARLTWGNRLRKPAEAPPPQPYWTWF